MPTPKRSRTEAQVEQEFFAARDEYHAAHQSSLEAQAREHAALKRYGEARRAYEAV